MEQEDINLDLTKLNKQIMPTVNDIESKMKMLQEKYNFSMDFSFPEITMEEITGEHKE